VTEQTDYRWKKRFGGLRMDQAKPFKELEKENSRLKRLLADAELDKAILREVAAGKVQARRSDGRRSSTFVAWLACAYGRDGYRRITALLHWEGWRVNHKRVERIWPEEGLKVPQKQPKQRRLWLNDGSCIRLRPTHRNHVWSYDFVMDRTSDGRPIRLLTIVDDYTRECLAIDVAKTLTSEDVLERLSDLFVRRGLPEHIRNDNGSEFTARSVREWLGRVGVQTLSIEPGSPWENNTLRPHRAGLSELRVHP